MTSASDPVCLSISLSAGGAFGDDRCLRISYAESLETLAKAMDRMEMGVKALK